MRWLSKQEGTSSLEGKVLPTYVFNNPSICPMAHDRPLILGLPQTSLLLSAFVLSVPSPGMLFPPMLMACCPLFSAFLQMSPSKRQSQIYLNDNSLVPSMISHPVLLDFPLQCIFYHILDQHCLLELSVIMEIMTLYHPNTVATSYMWLLNTSKWLVQLKN